MKTARSLIMSNEVLKFTVDSMKKVMSYYEKYSKPTAPPNTLFAAKKGNVSITAYKSGKVLFQGNESKQESEKWVNLSLSPSSNNSKKERKAPAASLPTGFATWSVLGSDEVGTGSYFGPLTVAAVYLSKDHLSLTTELGVRDSKDMKDKEIIKVAKDLLNFLPYSLLTVTPEKYNAIQPTMSQGKMKAILHNQALNNVLQKIAPIKPQGILIDQFELPATYYKHIQNQPVQIKHNVYFQTKGESHHLAVAAASILARYAFLTGLDQLTKKAGFTIPSGAGAASDMAAANILKKGGLPLLNHYAKLHFANTKKAQKIAGF